MSILKRIFLQLPIDAKFVISENVLARRMKEKHLDLGGDMKNLMIKLVNDSKNYSISVGISSEASDEEFMEVVTDLILKYQREVPLEY